MNEYITIKNIGPLKTIEDLPIMPFTVLIGESASGKSTLMKLVSMMRYLYKMANIRSYLKHSQITNSPFRMRFDTMMKETGMFKMLDSSSVIRYRVVMDDDTEYAIVMENKKLGKLPIISLEHLMFNKVSYISENRNIIPTWTQKASQNVGATLGFYFHETNNDFVRASANDKAISLDYLGMKLYITHPKGKPTRYTIIPNDERHAPIELREASSGVQTSASVALIVKDFASANGFSFKEAFKRSVLNYLYDMERLNKFKAVKEPSDLKKRVYIHVEEPELSLFPDAQCKLIEEIILSAAHAEENREIDIMLATHSPYILNFLNVLLNQTNPARAQLSKASTAVYRIYEGEAQDLLVQNERGRWIVDSYDLSELMSNIYQEFVTLDV
jgi:hypothetical protein